MPFAFEFFQLTSQNGGQTSGSSSLDDVLLVLDQLQDRDRYPFLLHHDQLVDQRIRGGEGVAAHLWYRQAIRQSRIYGSLDRSVCFSRHVETGTPFRLDALKIDEIKKTVFSFSKPLVTYDDHHVRMESLHG